MHSLGLFPLFIFIWAVLCVRSLTPSEENVRNSEGDTRHETVHSRNTLLRFMSFPFNVSAGCGDVSWGSAAYRGLRRARCSQIEWDQMEVSHWRTCDFVSGRREWSGVRWQNGWQCVFAGCHFGRLEVEISHR